MIARYAGSALLAIAVTFGLFFIMQALIATGRQAIVENPTETRIVLHRQERNEKPETIDRDLPEKPQVEKEPEVPEMQMAQANNANALNLGTPQLQANLDTDIDIGDAPADGDIMPLVRVPAQYPRNALSRGIEGYVILEFDINKEGTVENVRVVEAMPPNVFDREAIRAVEKFKYKPRIVNGQPAYRYGVQFQFTFDLEDNAR